MARGNGIIVEGVEPGGKFVEGIIGVGLTLYPGSVVQIQVATALVGGRWTWEVYNVAADGSRPSGPYILLLDDGYQGKLATASYGAGERAFGYIPKAGDELNVLLANIAGTGDDHTKGEVLIVDDTTGKFIATTGSPETEVAQLNETITDPTADQLVWATWTGY